MARPARPWTEADDSELRRLHAEGLSLRESARRLDRDYGTTGKKAKGLGLSFAVRTAGLEAAIQASQVDRKARRARQIEELNEIIDWRVSILREAKDQKRYTALVPAGPGMQVPLDLQFVPPEAMHKEAQAVAILLARVEALEKIDGDGGAAEAKGMLGSILSALRSSVAGLPRLNPTSPVSGEVATK